MFNSEDAPRTQDVADTITELIALPKSGRPFRTVVGADFGVKKLNEITAPIQEGLVQALELDHLTKVSVDD